MSIFRKLKKGSSVVPFIWDHPQNSGRRLRALGRALRWQVSKRLIGEPWLLSVFEDAKIYCYPHSTSASALIYGNGFSDYHEMYFIKRYLQAGDRFIDVGANIGVYTILAASIVGPDGSVTSFEPGPKALPRLEENVAVNEFDHVRIIASAVSEEEGEIDFVVDQDTTNRIQSGENANGRVQTVSVVTLDDALDRRRRFAMGKMDIEGAELLALRGAEKLLSAQNPPVWLLEINSSCREFGYEPQELASTLEAAGYVLGHYDALKGKLRITEEPWRERQNVLAVAGDELPLVRERVET